MRFKNILFSFFILLISGAAYGASFVVPPDRELIHRADAIVIGSALTSYARATDAGGIETVTPLSVDEVVKGRVADTTIDVVEPGGVLNGRAMIIAGVPRFREGTRLLLFLKKTGAERWSVSEIVLGKFSFHTRNGEALLLRDDDEISGWDPNLKPHRERERSADRFLHFVREEAAGRAAKEDYFVDNGSRFTPSAMSLHPAPAIAPYSATSYTMVISGAQGGRWAIFPSPVSFFSGTTTEPGAPGGGVTAIQAAMTSWDNDCGSNVNYVYAGTDNGSHTTGLHGADGANTVLFERDLSAWGVSPFTCSGNSYSGTLGLGGISSASGSNVVNGETFLTTQEGDVEMNRGLANCTLLFNNGDFNSAVTHELGHTLGFRHADQTRDSNGACSGDASLECSQQAIMKSFISTGLNANLQAWDQHAVQAVYPGNVCAPGPACTVPAITSHPSGVSITAGQTVTLTVGASGTAPLSYQWYTGAAGNTSSPIPNATGPSLTVGPSTTTSYWAKVTNSCGLANSNSATVTVTSNTASAATKFFLVTPCRIIDTRNANGPYGGPALPSGAVRNIVVAGVCGIPAGVVSISVNVAAVAPSASGYLTLFNGPASVPVPLASTLNYLTNRTLSNNAIVRAGSDSINVFNGGPAVHFVVDVNGYFK
jgi:hypothetical protein